MITHRTLSDEEYIREIDSKRAYSPIIDELCTRLEQSYRDECPVCEADLIAYKKTGERV